jgi:WD40 repeat protein
MRMIDWKRLSLLGATLACLGVLGAVRAGDEQPIQGGESLPRGALRRIGTTHFRTGGRVLALAFAPGDRWLASGCGDGPVTLWDSTTGRHKAPLADSWVYAIAFSPRSKIMATGGGFKVIRLWDLETNKEIHQLPLLGQPGAHKGTIRALAFSPDGKWLVSASEDRTIKVWDLQAKKERRSLKGHDDEVTCLTFLDDGRTLASGSGDRTIRLWDVEDGTFKGSLLTGGAVTSLAISANTLVSGGDDNLVRVWDLEGNRERQVLKGHKGAVAFVALLDQGRTVLSCAADREIRRWDTATGNPRGERFHYPQGNGDAFAISHDGKKLASGGLNNRIGILATETGQELNPTPGHQSGILSLAVSADGKKVAAGSRDRIRVWQADNGNHLADISTEAYCTGPLSELFLVFGRGDTLIAAYSQGDINFYDAKTGERKKGLKSPSGANVFCVTLSPDGKTLAVGYEKDGIRLLPTTDEGTETTLKYAGFVTNLAFSPDNKWLAATGKDKIAVFALPGGQQKLTLGTPGSSSCVAFSPNGPILFSGGYDGLIRLWDLNTSKEIKQIEGTVGAILSLAVAADGQTLLTGGMDKSVRLWEVASGQEIYQWKGHGGNVPAVGLAPNGRIAVSGSADTNLLVWDATGRLKDGQLAPVELEPGELPNLWNDLASTDMRKAHTAVWLCVSSPGHAVPFFEKSVFLTNPKYVDQLITDLDSIKFAVREKATIALKKMGRWIEDPLKRALETNPSIEVRRRLELILEQITKEGGISMEQEYWRIGRIIGILEQDASPESRKMLKLIAEGAAAAHLREMAQVSIRRMESRAQP